MSLTAISGPPGSGREDLILGRFEAALERDPLLVVPTRDDVDRIERELCRRPAGGLLGGSVTSFPALFEQVGAAVGVPATSSISRMQRVWLARAAARRTPLRQLYSSAQREGFAPAMETLIADLQAAGLDSAGLEVAAAELPDGAYEAEICGIFAAYERLRDELGLVDESTADSRAISGLRADPEAWRRRPVFLLGFDDLSRLQVELVEALSRAAEVTVAITFEQDHPALAARAALRATLVDELGAEAEVPLRPRTGELQGGEVVGTLRHIERQLFRSDAPAVGADGSLRLLEGAGDRSEVELIGRRIARLLADGTDPDDIAVAVRSPDRQAPLIARVLGDLGVPVAAEARVPLAATATGSAVLDLLAIAGEGGTAAQVVAFLRGPARARPESVDWLERRVLRERLAVAGDALEAWSGEASDVRVWELEALRAVRHDSGDLATELARIAADIAERPHLRSGVVPSSGPAVELRAAAEVARTLDEAMALGEHAPSPDELGELLAHVRVPLWRGTTEGRIRILSPYRLRATRLRHLFVAGLADGTFPARVPADPLLADERRAELGLARRSDPAEEERYLFYSCVSRPDETLHLSYPASDESGTPRPRSPFVDEVRSLLDPPPTADPATDEVEAEIVTRAQPEDVVPIPAEASTQRELARSLAVLGGTNGSPASDDLDIPDDVSTWVRARLEAAATALGASASPGPLSHPDVIAELAVERPHGASTLEEYDTCSYRWFVGHELDPHPLGPDPEPLEDGGIVHEVLERLYGAPPTASARPAPEDVGRWIDAGSKLIAEVASERRWNLGSANARIRIARFDAVLARFLRRDAATGGPMLPQPDLLELSFGLEPDDDHPPAELLGFSLHGRIDRIDVSLDRHALIRDYKLSSKAPAGKKLVDDGRLQMPLYMLAARGFGLDPIGGLYSPLGATKEDRPRGLINKDHRGSLVPGEKEHHFGTDFLDPDAFEEILSAAEERGAAIVAGMRAGVIERNPRGGECPSWCSLAPVCRIERGAAIEDPEAEEEEAA